MKGFLTFFIILGLISSALVLTSYSTLNVKSNQIRKIIIDAGHGGKDPGCIGETTYEKDIAYDIAQEFGSLVKTYINDVQIVYTRPEKHKFVELRERARIANREHADLFISLHCNASESPEIHGTETYVMGLNSSDENLKVAMRENASILKEGDYQEKYNGFNPNSPISYILMSNFQNVYQANSLRMAKNVESQFKHRLLRHSRGVKQSGFVVLWKTSMPSVLVETGFLTNRSEENYLQGERGKLQVASALYRAFRDYKQNIEK